MARPKLCNDTVPRNELDHRARDTRVRLVRLEQLHVPRDVVLGFWRKPLVRLFGFRIDGIGDAVIEAKDR